MWRPQSERKIVYKYYLYQTTVVFGFFWPIFTIFLLDRGLSYTEITLLNSISAAAIVVGEVPTGYVADRIGHRNSMLASSAIFVASIGGFAFAHTFLEFTVLWILWSFANTFRSGSADAWLYETLRERLDEEEYTRVRGRGTSANQWFSAATMLTAGGLYAIDPVFPFIAGATLNALGIPVLLTIPKTERYSGAGDEGEGENDDDAFTIREAIPVVRSQLSRPPLRSFVLYFAMLFGVVAVLDNFIQPIVVDDVGLAESSLGVVYAGFAVVSALASQYAARIEDALSTRGVVVVVPLVVSFALVVPVLFPIIALPAFFLMKGGREMLYPIMSGYVNDRVGSVGRATVLSTVSLLFALFRIPLQPVGGVVADATSPITAVAALVGLFVIAAVLLHLWEAPASSATEERSAVTD